MYRLIDKQESCDTDWDSIGLDVVLILCTFQILVSNKISTQITFLSISEAITPLFPFLMIVILPYLTINKIALAFNNLNNIQRYSTAVWIGQEVWCFYLKRYQKQTTLTTTNNFSTAAIFFSVSLNRSLS